MTLVGPLVKLTPRLKRLHSAMGGSSEPFKERVCRKNFERLPRHLLQSPRPRANVFS